MMVREVNDAGLVEVLGRVAAVSLQDKNLCPVGGGKKEEKTNGGRSSRRDWKKKRRSRSERCAVPGV